MLFFTAVFCSARIFILSTRSFPSFFCQTATLRTLSTIRCKSFFRYLNMSVPSVQAAIYAGPPRIPKGCGMRHAWVLHWYMLKCQSSKAGRTRTTKLLTLEPVDISSAPTLICEKYPRKGRMPGNPMSPGIYYEKAIWKVVLLSLIGLLYLMLLV